MGSRGTDTRVRSLYLTGGLDEGSGDEKNDTGMSGGGTGWGTGTGVNCCSKEADSDIPYGAKPALDSIVGGDAM